MLPLHFTTRRWICRIALIALCTAPTAGVLSWGVSRRWPGHSAACCRAIERELGVQVTGRSATHPRPGVLALEELALYDPESKAELVSLREVRIQELASGRRIAVGEATIEQEAFGELRRTLELWLRRGSQEDAPLRIEATRLLVTGPDGEPSHTLVDLVVQAGPTEAGCTAELEFRLEGHPSASPARLRLTRDRRGAIAVTRWELDTGTEALPGTLARGAYPLGERLGVAASFRGQLEWWQNESQSGGQATGELANVELKRLITGTFGVPVHGTADVTLERCQWRDGRLEAISGRVEGGPGAASYGMVVAAIDSLQLTVGERLQRRRTAGDPLEFRRLAAEFRLDGGGMWLKGLGVDGAILVADGPELLVGSSAGQSQPAAALVPILAPGRGIFVPATAQGAEILSWLPQETGKAAWRR